MVGTCAWTQVSQVSLFYQSAKSKVQKFQKCHVTEFGQTGAEWCVRPVFNVQSPKIRKKSRGRHVDKAND